MAISDENACALGIFPPSTLLEPYLDFFDFLYSHKEDFEDDVLIEEKNFFSDFYAHCIKHDPEKPHLKDQKPFLKKVAIDLLKKLHAVNFLTYANSFIQEVKWDLILDFNSLLKHIEKSDERKIKWGLYYFAKNQKGKTKKSFSDFEELLKDLKISSLKKTLSKIMKTKAKDIAAHLDIIMDPDVPLGKSFLRAYVDDLEWTSRRSPGELDDEILELLDRGSYSNKELVQILDTNKALISKSMNRLSKANEIIIHSQGTRGSHYYTTNCDNCPFGKDKFSCRNDAEKSIIKIIKSNYNVDITTKDLESIDTNQAVLKLNDILIQTLKEQNTKMESNLNQNLNQLFTTIFDTHAHRKMSTEPNRAYFTFNEIMEKMPVLLLVGFAQGSKSGSSLLTTLVDKVLKEKIPKKMYSQLQKEFLKEINKMSSILKK